MKHLILALVAIAAMSGSSRAQSASGTATQAIAVAPTGYILTTGGTAASPFTMTTQDLVVNKSTGSPTAIFLPANPVPWLDYTLTDGKGDAATNPITATPTTGTGTINGGPNLVLNQSGASLVAYSDGTNWHIK